MKKFQNQPMKNFVLLVLMILYLPARPAIQNNYRENLNITSKDPENNPLKDFFYWIFTEITYGIFIESFLEHDTPMHDASLTPYPYFNAGEGNYTYEKKAVPFRFEIAVNEAMDYQHSFFSNIRGKFRFGKRLEIAGFYTKLPQHTTPQNFFLTQTGFMLNYHRIRTKRFDMWYGFGMMFSDAPTHSSGFAFNVGGEWFLHKDFSVDASIKWANFDPETIRNTRINLNYFVGHWRLQTGLQYYKFMSERRSSIAFGLKYYF